MVAPFHHRKGVGNMDAYVTYECLFLYTTVLLSVISLTIAIIKGNKKK